MSDWRELHYDIMRSFVSYINTESDNFILKGGTSLLLCYKLDRFSEDLDFDGFKSNFFYLVDRFIIFMCRKGYSLSYRKGKDTETVKRAFIHYGGNKPLKVEVSYRKKSLYPGEVTIINNIRVYSICSIFSMKLNAFLGRDKLRDLYDIVFIYKNYNNCLNSSLLYQLREAVAYKGIEQFDFLIKDQKDVLINNDKLLEDFLSMYYSLGLN